MLFIPEGEIVKRAKNLPEKISNILNSTAIYSLINTVCQTNYLKKEWVDDVAMVTGEVLLGFLHSEDMAKEIQEITGLNYKVADNVAKDIGKRIFSPLKEEIEKNYSPLPPTEESKQTTPPTISRQEMKSSIPPVDLRPSEQPKSQEPKEEPKPLTPSMPPAPEEGPAILFKSETIASATPITTEKRKPTLGGLFGFSRRKETASKEKIIAEIETPTQRPQEKPTVAKTGAPTFKVVHYTQFEPQKQTDQTDGGPKMFVGQKPITPTPPPSFKPKIISVTPIPPSPKTYPEEKNLSPMQAKTITTLPIVPKAPITPPRQPIPTVIPIELPKPPQQLPPVVALPKPPEPAKDKEPTVATITKDEEMIDLVDLQKVKIKTEVEKTPAYRQAGKDETIIDLRK
ncbi:MAG: hypothetical protein WC297_02345 [Candidatus Paceibacterota bacterium]|jgi:hypothetical protein